MSRRTRSPAPPSAARGRGPLGRASDRRSPHVRGGDRHGRALLALLVLLALGLLLLGPVHSLLHTGGADHLCVACGCSAAPAPAPATAIAPAILGQAPAGALPAPPRTPSARPTRSRAPPRPAGH